MQDPMDTVSAEIPGIGLRAYVDDVKFFCRHADPKKAAEAKRHRGGYEDGVTLLYKEVSALDFLGSLALEWTLGGAGVH